MQKKRLIAGDKVQSCPFFLPPFAVAPDYHIAASFRQTAGLELCLCDFQYLIVWRLITGKP